jgi:hypothetical protein
MLEIYSWREPDWGSLDLTGFEVEAADGGIGRVDKRTRDVPTGFMVLDTGTWLLGETVILPVGVVHSIDLDDGKVFVDRTKDEIKDAPAFDERRLGDDLFQQEVGEHFESRPRTRARR